MAPNKSSRPYELDNTDEYFDWWRFKPVVKLMKWWRERTPTREKPKGFVIECITAECMNYSETYYGELFVQILENIVTKYEFNVLLNTVPDIPDPAGTGNSVTDGVTPAAFADFFNKAKAYRSSVGKLSTKLM